MTTTRHIVLFTRSPEDEARAKGLPSDAAARLFWALLASWRRSAEESGARLLVVSPSESVPRLAKLLAGPAASVEAQRGDSFGARIADAAKRAFDRGARAVLLVAGDCPPPADDVLESAFTALESGGSPLVLGPATDGGVNLIGLARPRPDLLVTVAQGSAHVERTLTRRARAAGLDVIRLPEARDLDRLADIHSVYRLSSALPAWRPYRTLLHAIVREAPLPPVHEVIAFRLAPLSCLPSRSPPPSA